jgi:hypothetical protein
MWMKDVAGFVQNAPISNESKAWIMLKISEALKAKNDYTFNVTDEPDFFRIGIYQKPPIPEFTLTESIVMEKLK